MKNSFRPGSVTCQMRGNLHPEDAAVCRICFDGSGLITGQVCACRGSAGLVHARCLVHWAASRWPNLTFWRTCSICGQDYVGAARLSLAQALHSKVRWRPLQRHSYLWVRDWAVENLICTLHEVGKHEQVAQRAEQSAASFRKRGKLHHPRALRISTVLASSLRELGRYQDAVELQRQALSVQRRVLGSSHPDAINSSNNLACTLSMMGDQVDEGHGFPLVKFRVYESGIQRTRSLLGAVCCKASVKKLPRYLEHH